MNNEKIINEINEDNINKDNINENYEDNINEIFEDNINSKLIMINKIKDEAVKQKKLYLLDKHLINIILQYYKPLIEIFNDEFAYEIIDIEPNISFYIEYTSWNTRYISAKYLYIKPELPTKFNGYPKIYKDFYTSSNNDYLSKSTGLLRRETHKYMQILRYNYKGELCWINLLDNNFINYKYVSILQVWKYLIQSLEKDEY
jgi:hypothetical protein